MRRLSDDIEKYIKGLLAESLTGQVEIRRNALAVRFGCAPSQINYVLTTRFTLWHGFYVESKRGGGGFLRISKLPAGNRDNFAREIFGFIDEAVSQAEAVAVIDRLEEEGLISIREASLMREAVTSGVMKAPPSLRSRLRAALLKSMVSAAFGAQVQNDRKRQKGVRGD
ncbi:MAG TPA: CtsR family transcriptional regulator [Desulfotomaculum sp.]|nr:CtsR family transcriptional regulator [Desulfotomaculum sp.]